MPRPSLRALALTTALLPLSVVGLVLTNGLRQRDLRVDLDPFEIDLQLTERNDAP